MFGFSHLAHQARRWQAHRERRALQGVLSGLPAELRKDIGWPAPDARDSGARVAEDLHARPIL